MTSICLVPRMQVYNDWGVPSRGIKTIYSIRLRQLALERTQVDNRVSCSSDARL